MVSDTNRPKTITLAVVALDEEILIEETVRSIFNQAKDHFSDFEILLINDGSQDATGQIMERLSIALPKVKVINNKTNIGLGASFQKALREAKFEYFMMLCGDGGLPAESLPAIFDVIGTVDIVVPYITNLNSIKTPMRYLLSRTYTTLLNLLFHQNLRYYNGLPVYKVNLLRQIKITSSGFGFQGEIITKLLKAGCSYTEVQVLGSEKAHRSRAVSVLNIISVGRTFFNLVWEILFFNPTTIKR